MSQQEKKMNYEEALEWIHRWAWQGTRPGLSRIAELTERLGHPEKDLRFVHVAGTNGKGSVCAMTESVLRCAGYNTGLFTSPFIWRFNERMAYNGEPIADDELAEIISYVRPFAEAMEDHPTEFELITAVGFVYFARKKCDVVVLEVGMGGRWDSTNVIQDPIACAITGIAFDHMALLGHTLTAIAKEKAGIIKPGAPVVFGGESEEADAVISAEAKAMGSRYVRVNRSAITLGSMELGATRFDYPGYPDVRIGLSGTYQPFNAATVIELVGLLRTRGLSITEQALRQGLKQAVWRGRFEILHRDPLLISDGSHNPEGIAAAIKSIHQYFPGQKIALLTGVLKDKDYTSMVAELAPVCARVFTLTPDYPSRALAAADLAAAYREKGVTSEAFETASDAMRAAAAYATAENCPIFSLGSLYLYAQIRTARNLLWGDSD